MNHIAILAPVPSLSLTARDNLRTFNCSHVVESSSAVSSGNYLRLARGRKVRVEARIRESRRGGNRSKTNATSSYPTHGAQSGLSCHATCRKNDGARALLA